MKRSFYEINFIHFGIHKIKYKQNDLRYFIILYKKSIYIKSVILKHKDAYFFSSIQRD